MPFSSPRLAKGRSISKNRNYDTHETPPSKLAFEVEPSPRLFRLRLARYRYLAQILGERLPDGPSVVLDAGCGKGRIPLYWRRWGPPNKTPRLIGLDLSPKRMVKAKLKHYPHLMAMDLTQKWPFRDGTADAVVCEQVMEHFDDRQFEHVLSEVRRVLKPGGTALIGTPIFTEVELWLSPIWMRINSVIRRLKGWSVTPHLQHMSAGRLWRRVAKSGLEPVSVRGCRIFTLWWSMGEDYEWYYRMHQWFGRHMPSLCNEVTVCAVNPVDPTAPAAVAATEALPATSETQPQQK